MMITIDGTNYTPEWEDYETFYGTKYSLKQLSYTEYLHDPRFRVEIVGRCGSEDQGQVLSGADIQQHYNTIDWKNTIFISHNAMFDAYVLKRHYGIEAGAYFCTMQAMKMVANHINHGLEACGDATGWTGPRKGDLGNALKNAFNKHLEDMTPQEQAEYKAYCLNDTLMCRHITKAIIKLLPDQELQCMNMYIKRFLNPKFVVDIDLCDKALDEAQKETKRLIAAATPVLHKYIAPPQTYFKHTAPARAEIALATSGKAKELKDKGEHQKIITVAPPKTIRTTEELLRKDAHFYAILEQILTAHGLDLPTKISDRTGLTIPACSRQDDEFMMLRQHSELQTLIDARLAVKSNIVKTRLERFKTIAAASDGCMPVASIYHSAHTGRPGATNKCNLMNLPRVIKNKPKPSDALRLSLMAPKGHVIITADFSNIEPRLTDWFCGQEEFLEAYRRGDDPYIALATRSTGLPASQITKELRQLNKVKKLQLSYGSGWRKYQTTLALGALGADPQYISEAEARHAVYNDYRPANPGITATWELLESQLHPMFNGEYRNHPRNYKCITFAHKAIWLPSGRKLDYSGLRQQFDDEGRLQWFYGLTKRTKIYGGAMLENLMQALARDIHVPAMLEINKHVAPVVGDTYDEISIIAPEHRAEDDMASMIEIMTRPVTWAPDLPLAAEADYDTRYSK